MKYIVVALLFSTLFTGLQTAYAVVLHGQVLRRNMTPVGNAEILVKKKGGDGVKKTKTNSSGVYSIDLDPGAYTLEVNGKSFKVRISNKKKRKDLKLP